MSLVEDLLKVLSSYNGGYKLMRRRMAGYTGPLLSDKFSKTSESTLRVTLSRLKRKGLVDNQGGAWRITKRGTVHLADKINFHNVYICIPVNCIIKERECIDRDSTTECNLIMGNLCKM